MSEKKATRVAYGEALVELGKNNDKIVVLDADLASATMTAARRPAAASFVSIGSHCETDL